MAARKTTPPEAGLPVGFKTVFWVVVILSLLSLIVAVYLATLPPPQHTEPVRNLIATCDTTWKMGFGGILGLLGGKRLP